MYKKILNISLFVGVVLSACKHKEEEKIEIGKFTVTSPIVMDTIFEKDYIAQIQSIQNVEIRAQVKGRG